MHSMELVFPRGIETEGARSKDSDLRLAIGTGVMCRWGLSCISGFEQNVLIHQGFTAHNLHIQTHNFPQFY